MTDTVFALATAPGRAAVAVLRISGPRAGEALRSLSGRIPEPRIATVRVLRNREREPLDQALILWFPGPASYTGEDCVELHLHGGEAVLARVTEALLADGLRLAWPGEFTRRAFENGKLELDRAEAIADLTDAETEAQARQALGQLTGRLGDHYRSWREQLIEALAVLEAAVDFPEDEIPEAVGVRAKAALTAVAEDLSAGLADEARGRRVREGYRVAVVGAPNAGKSSLFNAVAGRDAAIVAALPGTTRDVVEAHLTIEGYRVLLADTAGVRPTDDDVEAEGVRRARGRAIDAELRLWVVDQAAATGEWRYAADLVGPGDLLILNKSDLAQGRDGREACESDIGRGLRRVQTNMVSGDPAALLSVLSERIKADLSGADFPVATRLRHEDLLRETNTHLQRALTALATPELAAENVRLAARSLAKVSGQIDAESVLDRVFSTFCIGK